MTYIIQCPYCDHVGDTSADSFDISLADELFCPACGEMFFIEYPDDDDEEAAP